MLRLNTEYLFSTVKIHKSPSYLSIDMYMTAVGCITCVTANLRA